MANFEMNELKATSENAKRRSFQLNSIHSLEKFRGGLEVYEGANSEISMVMEYCSGFELCARVLAGQRAGQQGGQLSQSAQDSIWQFF